MDVIQGNMALISREKRPRIVDCHNNKFHNLKNVTILNLQNNADDDDFYDSYNWLNDIDKFYKDDANICNLQNDNEQTGIVFDDSDDSEDYDGQSSGSSSDSDNSSDDSECENPSKKSRYENIDELKEEINDLKKDMINNSGSFDHIEIALDNLRQIRKDNPKEKVSVVIKKFKEEIDKLDELKTTSGIKMFEDLFLKYRNAYNDVYEMIHKEYNKKKEKLNINTWTTSEIEKRKKTMNKQIENDFIFTILYPQPCTNNSNNNDNISGWGGKPIKDQELITEFTNLYKQDSANRSGTEYFKELSTNEKKKYIKKLKEIKKLDGELDNKPNMAKILESETTNNNKSIILSKINTFENLKGSSEYYKLKSWITKIMKVPFGKYVLPPVNKNDGSEKIKEYLQSVRKNLDQDIYGHDVTKNQLIKILAHTIANPSEGGNIFALQGPPGVGKTALIQDGISKALGRPFTFICLGGATDACFLEGHDYTYEGSNHGRIVELLQQAGCMNPVIYFDELDKVSETAKGEEIINILMHITDVTQNSHFNDKYFGGLDFDLSKAIIIFSFNDEQKISRILRDRMKIIKVEGYKMLDKINIARDYLLPKLIKQIGLDIEIKFSDEILEYIIDNYTYEGGVRKLKETLNDILLEINLRKLEDNTILDKKITNKIIITKEMLENDFLKKRHKIEHIKINKKSNVGQVNGLWANKYGVGGLIPIECCWIPAKEKLSLELTGMQGKVMQESMMVARTIAWKVIPDEIKERLNCKWQNSFDYGIHIHCPDGSTPKDGPSAGGAITTCLISLLTGIPVNNKIAMTGEINLKGQITKIGGLEEKLFGAKKAGAELVLYPRENKKDLDEIIEKFPSLINSSFNVEIIDNIWDILDKVLIRKINYIKF